ncbi:MAG: cation:proton antiporter [Cyanobacteria bacterium]|nr:cation:proton antiporter [Cyanobacteriota bacterium]
MTTLTTIWIALPFLVGFGIYLLPKLDRALALAVASTSIGYGCWQLLAPADLTLVLLNRFGVTLMVDSLSGFFILTNGLVTAAVMLYCWQKGKSAFFYTQAIILHGSVNSVFICADFISVYVALEVISIAAFLLITYPRSNRSIWVGLRYLFVSNTAMLFYLIGAVLVYQASKSFAFAGLGAAPTEAVAFIFLGLLTKGGIFVSGLWLPLTHSEAETPVSALLSGVVVNTGIFPLVRCALMVPELLPMLQAFSVATALLGVSYAILEKDTKRMLAASTISQLGFVLAAPAAAGFYALTHGLAKAALFLIAGSLPSRNFQTLQAQFISRKLGLAIAIPSLSISGFPLFAGFGAKALTLKDLAPPQMVVMTVASLGTAIAFSKFIFLPFKTQTIAVDIAKSASGFWGAIMVLLGALIIATGLHLETYQMGNIIKAILTVSLGWLVYRLFLKDLCLQLPKGIERLENLIGVMSLVLVSLFGMLLA